MPLPLRGAAVLLQDVPHALAQGDDPVVEDPFVRIVDDLRLGRGCGGRAVAVQADVLADDAGHLRVAEIGEQARPRFGMILLGPETPCLGDVVEKRRGPDQLPVESGKAETVGQEAGKPGRPAGNGPRCFPAYPSRK